VSVVPAEDPVEARNLEGRADAGVDGGFVEGGAIEAEAFPGDESDIAANPEMVGEVELDQASVGGGRGVRLGGG